MADLKVVDRPLDGKTCVVEPRGDIDMHTAPALKKSTYGLIDAGYCNLLVNLEGVTFIDSSGLAVLLGTLKRLREVNGRMALITKDPVILRILKLTSLIEVFEVLESEAQALETIRT